jgi:hypothetical protein
MQKLNNEEIIEILDKAIQKVEYNKKNRILADRDYYPCGLCFIFRTLFKNNIKEYNAIKSISYYIPEFTQENAIKYSNSKESAYWWKTDPFDYDNRIKFLQWIKSNYEKNK